MMLKHSLIAGFLTILLASLFGCGGGSSSSSINDSSNYPPVNNPQEISNNNFVGVNVLSREPIPGISVTTDADTITLSYSNASPIPGGHYQLYINVDNNPETGFRFSNEIWDDAGTDYLVEDGILFKSIANDSSWSWDMNVAPVVYSTESGVSVTIKKTDLRGLSPIIRVGYINRDINWNVDSFYPRSTLMQEFHVDVEPPTDDYIIPVIRLNGSEHIKLLTNTDFIDPGATASDNVDGDVTDKITVESNLDTRRPGQYTIVYRVSDSSGNSAIATRTVIVVDNLPDGIVIDGFSDDWADIPTLAEEDGATLKVTDQGNKLYVLVQSRESLENTQIFMNVDNNASTGNQLSGSFWSPAGADYMIENDHLDINRNSAPWAWNWDYNINPINFIKQDNTIEVAIPKSALEYLGDTIKIGFVNRNESWNVKSMLPANGMLSYDMNSATVSKVLLPNFCDGSIWETDGTPEFTRKSALANRSSHNDLLIEHNNNWYTVYDSVDGGTGESEVTIVKFDGVHIIQFLPLHLVRSEPLGNDTITDLKFLGDNIYFVFANELWSNNKLVKKFEGKKIVGLYPSGNFIAVHIKDTGSHLNETWIMNGATDTLAESVFKVELENASPLFAHKAQNTVYLTDGTDYYLSDNTHSYQKLDKMPLTSKGNKVYFAKNKGNIDNNPYHIDKYSLWVKDGNDSLKAINSAVSGKPTVPDANGAAYLIAADFPVTQEGTNTLFYLWRFDENTDELIKISQKTNNQNSVVTEILSPSFVHGHDYYISQQKHVSGEPGNYTTDYYISRDLFVATDNGNNPGIKTRPLELPTVGNESSIAGLVYKAGNLYFIDTRQGSKNISMINAASDPFTSQYTSLGACN